MIKQISAAFFIARVTFSVAEAGANDQFEFEFEFIGVLRHMQQYFSHMCEGTDVQAD